jgi:P27 family predicted phage terminase small subunit
MTAGRPATPTALKRLAGNPGKRALNDSEPQFPAGRPPCPTHLVGEAKKEWSRVTKLLLDAGLLTKADRAALSAYCQAWADWVAANEAMAKPNAEGGGLVVVTGEGYPMLNPLWTVSQQAVKVMRSYLTEFGLTPAARSRMKVSNVGRRMTVAEMLDDAVDGDGGEDGETD